MAITALARKLVTIAYLMLKSNEPYRYARPDLMRRKFLKLKVLSKASGPGFGLAGVYQDAKLPAVTVPGALPNGEQRMLKQRKLTSYVADLYVDNAGSKKTSDPAKQGRPRGRPQ